MIARRPFVLLPIKQEDSMDRTDEIDVLERKTTALAQIVSALFDAMNSPSDSERARYMSAAKYEFKRSFLAK